MFFFFSRPPMRKAIIACFLTSPLWAQQAPSTLQTTPIADSPSSPFLSRWLNVQAGLLAVRYKRVKSTGQPYLNQLQYNFQMLGRLNFDREDRCGVSFAIGTGRAFSSAWMTTGVGDGDLAANVYLKQVYLRALPWKGVEVQFGGIGFNRGESTENTSYSNNGYMMGERIRLKYSRQLYFDEVSLTTAYLGDISIPNVFRRFHRLSQINYTQILADKRINRHFSFSADITSHEGARTLRQAAKINLSKNHILDSVVFESYQRVNANAAAGFGLTLEKGVRKLNLAGGYLTVDKDYGPWNSDRLARGRRLYFSPRIPLWKDFGLAAFFTQAIANDFPVTIHTRFELILTYDLQKAIHRTGIL